MSIKLSTSDLYDFITWYENNQRADVFMPRCMLNFYNFAKEHFNNYPETKCPDCKGTGKVKRYVAHEHSDFEHLQTEKCSCQQ